MEPFEIKDLLTVRGKPGLWRLVTLLKGRMARIKNLLDEKNCATVKASEVVAINSYTIFLKDGEISLEKAIDNILEMEEKGLVTREEISSYDKLSDYAKEDMMKKLVPNYDENKFKHYHLSKLTKWYIEIVKALDLLNEGIEDPYSKTNTEEENEN